MATCFDVAKYILEKMGPTETVKLQKLAYYAQAWSLAWDEGKLFPERIEAWISGPVIPELFEFHRGKYSISAEEMKGNPAILHAMQKKTIDKVIEFYGDKDSQWLSDLTHLEDPWKLARKGLKANERGRSEITTASMAEFYSSIFDEEDEGDG